MQTDLDPAPDAPGHRPRWRMVLASARWPLAAALLGMLLSLPALSVGWIIDDIFHRCALVGSESFGEFADAPLDMFRFFDGDPERTRRMMDVGFVPWWTLPQLKAAFWRPLTVVTHWLDYQFWPGSAAGMHAHSILWYGLLIVLVGLLYRRLQAPAWLAGLATLIYAIDDAHGMPVAFLANRNVLISTTFGVLTLLAHDAWRRNGFKPGALLAPLGLLLSLLAKEAGIATCAYLGAHAACLDRESLRKRILVLLPYVLIVVGWRVAWSAQGYAVEHAGPYIDPLAEPARFAAAALFNAPILWLGQFALPPAELTLLLSDRATLILWLGALLVILLLLVGLWPLLRSDRTARFWLLGAAFATVPICATFPADRLLVFVGLGAAPLIAGYLRFAFVRNAGSIGRTPLPHRCLAGILLVLHLLVAPVALPLRAARPAGPAIVEQLYFRAPLDDDVTRQTLVLVNAPSILHIAYLLPERELAGETIPQRVRVLGTGFHPIHVQRPDIDTLILTPKQGFLSWRFEKLFRADTHAFDVGDTIPLTGLTVEILELTTDRRPAVVAFHFNRPLESSTLRWFCFTDLCFQPWQPPPVGTETTVDPGNLMGALIGGTDD